MRVTDPRSLAYRRHAWDHDGQSRLDQRPCPGDPSGSANDDGQGARAGQARHNRRRHPLTRSFGAGGRRRATATGCRVAVRGDRHRMGKQGGCLRCRPMGACRRLEHPSWPSTVAASGEPQRDAEAARGDVRARHAEGAVQSGQQVGGKNGQRPVVTAAAGLSGSVSQARRQRQLTRRCGSCSSAWPQRSALGLLPSERRRCVQAGVESRRVTARPG
jgi:hypothetical protein